MLKVVIIGLLAVSVISSHKPGLRMLKNQFGDSEISVTRLKYLEKQMPSPVPLEDYLQVEGRLLNASLYPESSGLSIRGRLTLKSTAEKAEQIVTVGNVTLSVASATRNHSKVFKWYHQGTQMGNPIQTNFEFDRFSFSPLLWGNENAVLVVASSILKTDNYYYFMVLNSTSLMASFTFQSKKNYTSPTFQIFPLLNTYGLYSHLVVSTDAATGATTTFEVRIRDSLQGIDVTNEQCLPPADFVSAAITLSTKEIILVRYNTGSPFFSLSIYSASTGRKEKEITINLDPATIGPIDQKPYMVKAFSGEYSDFSIIFFPKYGDFIPYGTFFEYKVYPEDKFRTDIYTY